MTNSNDLQFSEMLDWLEGRLSGAEAQRVVQSMETADGATLADLEWLRSFLEISATARAPSLSEVRTNLREQFRAYIQTKRTPSVFQRILATLTFDSRTQFATSGVRSAAMEGKRHQLIYDTNQAEISLNIQPHPQEERMTLIGQIYPKGDLSPEGFTVQLVEAEGVAESGVAVSDELGEFMVESLPEGQYDIFITAEGFEIVLPDVSLRQ